jgi:hypothetical protein
MSQLPSSHNASFERLLDEGFTIFRRGPFVVGVVPFLDEGGQISEGYLVDVISGGEGEKAGPPANHQFYFSGGTPRNLDGSTLNLGGGVNEAQLFDDVKATWYWSFKTTENGQPRDYLDFYEKFKHYFDAITGPVAHKYPDFELCPFRNVLSKEDEDSPFVFNDEHSARAGIMDIRQRLLAHNVGIIGVGGTGGFVLDLLSKSPVNRIAIFDPDTMKVHNTFRAPGPTLREDLGRTKVELLKGRYARTHKRIEARPVAITTDNANELDGLTFVFVCVDSARARRDIAKILLAKDIPFIDTGMGLNRGAKGLTGMVRTTLCRPESREQATQTLANESHEPVADEYHTNIQTADLNALNAATAVMMFKKFAGYYDELPISWQSLLTVQSGHTIRYLC